MESVGDGDSSNGRPPVISQTLCQKNMQHTSSVAMETCKVWHMGHETLWTWQQHMKRRYRGPWQIRGLAA
ncbi:unnamed protein product, partial [Staurois parvus]